LVRTTLEKLNELSLDDPKTPVGDAPKSNIGPVSQQGQGELLAVSWFESVGRTGKPTYEHGLIRKTGIERWRAEAKSEYRAVILHCDHVPPGGGGRKTPREERVSWHDLFANTIEKGRVEDRTSSLGTCLFRHTGVRSTNQKAAARAHPSREKGGKGKWQNAMEKTKKPSRKKISWAWRRNTAN